MRTPSYEANILDLIEKNELKAKLDKCSKAIIASRQVLARIMQAVIPEYKNCTIEEILPLIGTVVVGEETVNRDEVASDLSDRVSGDNSEDNSISEGTRYYDMKFSAVTPDNQTIGLIINIEIQNDFNVDYPLIKRAIYYGSRMISAQYGTIFKKSEFDKIQKVYSVWICTSPDEVHKNTISQYEFTRKNILGELTDTEKDKADYDLISIIMICLGESETKKCRGIIRFLNTLLVKNISAEEKKRIMEDEYDLPMTKELDEELNDMCNVSDLYWNGGVAEGMAKGMEEGMTKGMAEGEMQEKLATITEMMKEKMPIEVIAKIARLSVPETENIIKEYIKQ